MATTTKKNRPASITAKLMTRIDFEPTMILKAPEGSFVSQNVYETSAAAPKTRSRDDAMAERYRKDPELAIETLNDILEEGDQGELLVMLRHMALAKGMSEIAKETDLNRSQLYRTLSEAGNPSLNNLIAILKAMGLRLSVQTIEQDP
jgi:probable addiction module antidote protein